MVGSLAHQVFGIDDMSCVFDNVQGQALEHQVDTIGLPARVAPEQAGSGLIGVFGGAR
jgi:hypothetical protein